MANTTARIAASTDGLVTIDVEYAANFDIRRFTITNGGGSSTVTAIVYKDGVSGSWSLSAPPGQTVSDTTPANLVAFPNDGTGNPAIPFSTLSAPVWYGEFGIWRWVVTS